MHPKKTVDTFFLRTAHTHTQKLPAIFLKKCADNFFLNWSQKIANRLQKTEKCLQKIEKCLKKTYFLPQRRTIKHLSNYYPWNLIRVKNQ